MFQVAIFVKNCKFKMKCVEKHDASAFGASQFPWLFLNNSVFQQNSKFLTNFKISWLFPDQWQPCLCICVCVTVQLIVLKQLWESI